MSWTPHRGRRRPRFSSWSFRTFMWVLRREAALRIIFADVMETMLEPEARLQVSRSRTDKLDIACRMLLAGEPGRAHYPTAYNADGEISTVRETRAAEDYSRVRCIDADCPVIGPHPAHGFPATAEPPPP